MNWQHYEPWQMATACLIDDGRDCDCRYEIGAITTGKQRVFHRYYVRIRLSDGAEVVGQSEHSIHAALLKVDSQLCARGVVLLAAGADSEFYETGLSANSGYGYLPNMDRAIHMMAVPPPRLREDGNDKFIEGLIREAVDGLFRKPIPNVDNPPPS